MSYSSLPATKTETAPVIAPPAGRSIASDLYSLLREQACGTPQAIAIAAPDRSPLTYARLLEQVDAGIRALQALGLGPGDRVAIVLPNGPEMAVAFLTVAACATCAPLNPSYRATEFDFYLTDLGAAVLIVLAGTDSPAQAVARARGVPIIELAPDLCAEAGAFTLSGSQAARSSSLALPQPEDVALVLHTSGTTSRPKLVPLTHRNLCASAFQIRTTLELTTPDRCLNVMPLFHIHGLVGALLSSLAAGASVVCPSDFVVTEFFAWLNEFQPTWYTAVPTLHQSILKRAVAHRDVIARCPLRFIRSASSALPGRVMEELERVFHVPVIEAYGMTEAAHQIASNPLPPRPRKPGAVGLAAGPEVAVMDDTGRPLPPDETGEVVIRGASVTRGYEANPEANQAAFTHGWLRTGDLGRLDTDGYLFLSGRRKEIINRGGEKISPREVEEVLLEHPALAQVVAFALPDERVGEDVAVAVVPREGSVVTPTEIRRFAAERLADFKVPRKVLVLDEIPQGPTGKPQRIGMAERLGLTTLDPSGVGPVTSNGTPPPRTPLEKVLANLWCQVLQVEQVGIHDEFLQLGGDSLLGTRLIACIRDLLRVELSVLNLFNEAPTVAEMAAAILRDPAARAKVERTAQLWVEVAELSESDVESALQKLSPQAGGADPGRPRR